MNDYRALALLLGYLALAAIVAVWRRQGWRGR